MDDQGFTIVGSDTGIATMVSCTRSNLTVTQAEADKCKIAVPEEPVAYLSHKYTKSNIPVYKHMKWIHRVFCKWLLGFEYINLK